MGERIDAGGLRVRIDVHDQSQIERRDHLVAEFDHLAKLPRGVDMEQRKRDARRIKRLLRETQHHRAVLADRVQHHRPLAFSDGLAENLDALGLEIFQVV